MAARRTVNDRLADSGLPHPVANVDVMSTAEQAQRWQHVIDQAVMPFEMSIGVMRNGGVKAFPHAQAVVMAAAAISQTPIDNLTRG